MNLNNYITPRDAAQGGIFIIMVGPPGCGKSSIAKKIADTYSNFVIVSPDNIRKELFGDESIQKHNDEVFAVVYKRLSTYLNEGRNVIYDATNCRTTYRFKILDICKPIAKKIICLVSTVSMSECLRRNEMREYKVPENVIERMYINYTRHSPTIFEGYDAIIRFE